MGPLKCLRLVILAFAMAVLSLSQAQAVPPETKQSVVSVLPVWPGRAQGGAGAPSGVAPEGSGVVLRANVIATAWHVIEPADRIDVRLHDGRILPAELIAHDAASDVALLKIDANLPAITTTTEAELATRACSIGNAFGLGLSVTCGVVSALHVSNAGFNSVEDFVQTDTALNPGSSGGALVDAQGRLVGMVSAIFASEGGTNTGVGFAVSTELLLRVTDDLLETGTVVYPEPGWRLAVAAREERARLAAPVVRSLEADGPAGAAGVQPGDLIVQIGPRRVQTARDAIAALAVLPGDAEQVEIVIDRGGTRQTLVLPLTSPKDVPQPKLADALLGDCPHPRPVCLMRQAVFPVSSFDPLGSATRIGPDLLVTNRHVVGNRTDAVIHTPDGPRGAKVIPSSYKGDLVLLQVDGLPDGWHIPARDTAGLSAPSFFAVGADAARQVIRVFEPGALIAHPAQDAEFGRIHVTAHMQPGISGGALVDAQGNLVGIAVGGGDGRFEAIPLSNIAALLTGRSDENAAAVTAQLGQAFVDCVTAIDGATSGQAATLAAMAEPCAAAMNHGQLLEAGRVLAQARQYAAAAELHAQAVHQVPNSINARISLLVSLQLGARFEEMTEHARFVMDMAPDDPDVLRFAIQSGVWGNAPDLAEEGYQRLLKANPRQAEAARRFIDSAPPAPVQRN